MRDARDSRTIRFVNQRPRLSSRLARVSLVAALFAAGGAAVLHCGSSDPDSIFPDAATDPCETVYQGKCGAACTADETCADGLYCRAGKCGADCSPGARGLCPEGVACSPRGRCGSDPTDSGIVDGSADAKDDGTCAAVDVEVTKVVPTVLLLIDQSSSMEYDFNGGNKMPPAFPNSRWVKLREALMDADGGIVKKYEGDVEFGLALYSANNGNEKPPAVAACPIMKTVPFAKTNHAAMDAIYSTELPIDDTPTPDAVRVAAGIDDAGAPIDGGFAATPTGRPKVLVLATDGEPGRCGTVETLEATGSPESRQAVVDAVQAAYRAGIKTYVITVGSSVSQAHQQDVANAGFGYFDGGADAASDASAPLFRTTSQAELARAFDSIIFGVQSCTFKLAGQVVMGTEALGDVRLNGKPLGYNDPNGWKLVSPNEIELTGASCAELKSSAAKLTVRFPCNSFIPR